MSHQLTTLISTSSHCLRMLRTSSVRSPRHQYQQIFPLFSRKVRHILSSVHLPDVKAGCNYAWVSQVPNPNEANSALTYYLHLGQLTDPRQRVVGFLLVEIMSEPAFDALPTIGDLVLCSRWDLPGDSHFGLRILLQSERSSAYLEGRVEAFLDSMDEKIREMRSGEFQDFKSGLQQKWKEPPEDLGEELLRYWSQIESGYLDFLRGECKCMVVYMRITYLSLDFQNTRMPT